MTDTPREASKLGQFSWALFDWANQPFFTVVTTFIFAPYFANVMVGDPVKGQSAWAFTQSTSGILIALMSPFLGAMADAGGRRKPYIFVFQLLLFVGCAALWWAYPNRPELAGPIGWAVVLATVGAEMSIVFNNAQLPNIVRPERMGWLSGFGWGMGYVRRADRRCGMRCSPQQSVAVRPRSEPYARAADRARLGAVAGDLRAADVPVHAGHGPGPAPAAAASARSRAAGRW